MMADRELLVLAGASQMHGETPATHLSLEAKNSWEKCGICCTPVTSRGVLDCCSDIFCFSCIDTWSAFTNLCPLCKLQFKFITFVPVADDEDSSDVDTQGAFFDFLGQERDASWNDDNEEDGTLSFPSYFIEEDAVVCLDGDGCRVRAGLTEDGEFGLEDTSVACDACDCWYHAFCVGYKPDSQNERSWICPRCVGTGVLDLFKFQPSSTKSCTSKPSNRSMSLDENGSITFVDEGETAVVVSMDASRHSMFHSQISQPPSIKSSRSNTTLDGAFEAAVVDTKEKCVVVSMDATGLPLDDRSIIASDAYLPHPEKTAKVNDSDVETIEVENPSLFTCTMQQAPGTVSIEPTASIDQAENTTRETASVNSQKMVDEKGDTSLPLPSTFLHSDVATIDNTVITSAETSCKLTIQETPKAVSDDCSQIRKEEVVDADVVLDSIDIECKRAFDVEQGSKAMKQEDSCDTQHDKFSAKKRGPFQSLHQSQKKKLKLEDRRSPLTDNLQSQEAVSEGSFSKRAPSEVIQKRVSGEQPTKELLVEPAVSDEMLQDDFADFKLDAVSMQEAFKPKSKVMDELKELVQGLGSCHRRVIPRANANKGSNGTSEGVRVRKIVYRGSDLEGKASKIVDQMRHHLKEAAGPNATSDIGKVDVTDEKFFAAFRAAVLNSQDSLRQQMAPPERAIFHKPGPKRDGSRQSLMKKLYGGTGKRRQAWDRDWDISFWRERVSNEKKARQSSRDLLQQEMAQIEEARRDSKKFNKAELDSLRSRVYLADTSLLPRQTDIKPLSAQLSCKTSPIPVQQTKVAGHIKTAKGVPEHATAAEGFNACASDSNQVLKMDKRKWALDVLARKTRQQEKIPGNKGSLLAELPEHMRPILEYDRRSKVPTASRQVQLDRFVEYYLQKAQVDSVNDSAECKDAISAAVSKEKEMYDKSHSKGVYVNLCVQALSVSPKVATPQATETLLLRAAETVQYEDLTILKALKAAGLISDSPPESPLHDGQEGSIRNPHDIDNNFDIGNDHSVETHENTHLDNSEAGREISHGTGIENAKDAESSLACIKEEIFSRHNDCQMEKLQEESEPHEITLPSLPRGQEMVQQEGAEGELHCSAVDAPVQEGPLLVSESITRERTAVDGVLQTSGTIERISKQVEKYVKEHIRPLHRSHVITTEQYKWAVAKTTNKVMQHHTLARSADFLIPEGEKVKRLAEQYLRLYDEHKLYGEN